MLEWEQKRQHMSHYDSTAHIYNTRYAEEQDLKIRAMFEDLELAGQSTALDLGCGTGLLLPELQKTARSIVGLDISRRMLKEAERFRKYRERVHFVLADADHTPLRPRCFDAVFVLTLLQNMPNPRHSLQEVERIIKTNGLVVVTGLKKSFTEHSFVKLLKSGKLKVRLVKAEDEVKCHIAICQKQK